MKKRATLSFYMLLVFALGATVFTSCSKDDEDEANTEETTTGTSVLINGVKWATKNVATPGTFTTTPEAYGYFYQWNNKVGWPSTGAIGSIIATNGSTTWNSSWNGGFTTPSSTDTWATANDPSPAGYRVPTKAEISSLIHTTKVSSTWTTQNSVYGRKFTDIATGNSLFFPVSGFRGDYDGTLDNADSYCSCWSSTVFDSGEAYNLGFGSGDAGWVYSTNRAYGFTVRPVSE